MVNKSYTPETCEVFRIFTLYPADGLDNLQYTETYSGYKCLVPKTIKLNDTVVFIPPQSVVDTAREEFAFLAKINKSGKITAQRFRGNWSYGLIIPAPPWAKPGDDLTEHLGIKHWTPEKDEPRPSPKTKTMFWSKIKTFIFHIKSSHVPPKRHPDYDLDNWVKFSGLLTPGEMVSITEKIHGTNASYSYQSVFGFNPKIYVKSHYQYKSPTTPGFHGDVWHGILKKTGWLRELCKKYKNIVFYGEIFGNKIQKEILYGHETNIRIFDAYDTNTKTWWNREKLEAAVKLTFSPCFVDNYLVHEYTREPYYPGLVERYLTGQSYYNPLEIREGIVISSIQNRLALKAINPFYLERIGRR
jgi:hypothetical protein